MIWQAVMSLAKEAPVEAQPEDSEKEMMRKKLEDVNRLRN